MRKISQQFSNLCHVEDTSNLVPASVCGNTTYPTASRKFLLYITVRVQKERRGQNIAVCFKMTMEACGELPPLNTELFRYPSSGRHSVCEWVFWRISICVFLPHVAYQMILCLFCGKSVHGSVLLAIPKGSEQRCHRMKSEYLSHSTRVS